MTNQTKQETTIQDQYKKYARPMIIRSVFQSIMHMADKLIAALFIGESALVATTLVSPLMFFVAALSTFFISGLAAYVGLLIGRNKVDKANHISSGILLIMAVLGTLLAIPCILFPEALSAFLGARGTFLTLSTDYLFIFAFSFPLMLVGKGLDALILNDGSPEFSFRINMITTLMNIGLNAFAVIVLGWGIQGLALATVISSAYQLLCGLYYFAFRSKVIHLKSPSFHIPTVIRIAFNGFSDFVMMIVEAVMVFVINKAFVTYLTPAHFEAYAAVSIFMVIFYSLYMGAPMGLQPMFSQMMGRKDFQQLLDLLKFSVKRTQTIGAVAYVLLIPLMPHLLKLFVDSPQALGYGQTLYVTMGAATLLINLPLQASIFYTAINRPLESAGISVIRTLVLVPPLVYTFIATTGIWGLALGNALTDMIMIGLVLAWMAKHPLGSLQVAD